MQSGGQLPFDRNEPSPEPDDGMDETDVDGFFADDNELVTNSQILFFVLKYAEFCFSQMLF